MKNLIIILTFIFSTLSFAHPALADPYYINTKTTLDSSFVRFINPDRLQVTSRDKASRDTVLGEDALKPIGPYLGWPSERSTIIMGGAHAEYDFNVRNFYTVFVIPGLSKLAIVPENLMFYDAVNVNDYKTKAKIRLFDLSSINEVMIKAKDLKLVYASGRNYIGEDRPHALTREFLIDPTDSLSLFIPSQKLADFPKVPIYAGKTYTILIRGTSAQPELYLAMTPSPFDLPE